MVTMEFRARLPGTILNMRTDSQVPPRGVPVKDTASWLGQLTFVRWMLLSHVLVSLPLLGLAVWVTLALLSEREATQQQALQRRTDVTASAMARKLDSTQVQLSSLLLSRPASAQRPDAGPPGPAEWAQLRELAGRLVTADPDLLAVHAWGSWWGKKPRSCRQRA
jgi:hypothetical protein